jgi:XTP/dITP diphosphohydrolase
MPITELVIATGNEHKVAELRAIFASCGVSVLGLSDLPGHERFVEPAETGATFEANARIKALSYAAQTGRVCLADDSGIEIDALTLPGAAPRPGVISSHYCTNGTDTIPPMTRAQRDAANNARVLRELDGLPLERRGARFVCCMCLAEPSGTPALGTPPVPGGSWVFQDIRRGPAGYPEAGHPAGTILHETRGTMEGRIGLPPRVPAGGSGFGYDPLFLVAPGFDRTGAELSAGEKNAMSHRAAAGLAMAAWLRSAR